MTGRPLKIRVERLVLDGVPAGQHQAVTAAIERELLRQLVAPAGPGTSTALPAVTVAAPAPADGAGAGRAAAAAIVHAVAGGRR